MLPANGKPIINKKEINTMKKNSVINNTARGNLVNEIDLKEALDSLTIEVIDAVKNENVRIIILDDAEFFFQKFSTFIYQFAEY